MIPTSLNTRSLESIEVGRLAASHRPMSEPSSAYTEKLLLEPTISQTDLLVDLYFKLLKIRPATVLTSFHTFQTLEGISEKQPVTVCNLIQFWKATPTEIQINQVAHSLDWPSVPDDSSRKLNCGVGASLLSNRVPDCSDCNG